MRLLFSIVVCLVITSSSLYAQNIDILKNEIVKIIANKNATIGVSIKSIEDKDTLSINGNLNAPLMCGN